MVTLRVLGILTCISIVFIRPVFATHTEEDPEAERARQLKEAGDFVKPGWDALDTAPTKEQFMFHEPMGVTCTDFQREAFGAIIFNLGGRIVLAKKNDRAPTFYSKIYEHLENTVKNPPKEFESIKKLRNAVATLKFGIAKDEILMKLSPFFEGVKGEKEIKKKFDESDTKAAIQKLREDPLVKAYLAVGNDFDFLITLARLNYLPDKVPGNLKALQDTDKKKLQARLAELATLEPQIELWEQRVRTMKSFFQRAKEAVLKNFPDLDYVPQGLDKNGIFVFSFDDKHPSQKSGYSRYQQIKFTRLFGHPVYGDDELRAKVKLSKVPNIDQDVFYASGMGFQLVTNRMENGKKVIQTFTCY
jgi:hypothetical protein